MTILLNLASIPAEVVRKIDFEDLWSVRFRADMEAYKEEWQQKYGRVYRTQSLHLEHEFIENMKRRAQVDEELR